MSIVTPVNGAPTTLDYGSQEQPTLSLEKRLSDRLAEMDPSRAKAKTKTKTQDESAVPILVAPSAAELPVLDQTLIVKSVPASPGMAAHQHRRTPQAAAPIAAVALPSRGVAQVAQVQVDAALPETAPPVRLPSVDPSTSVQSPRTLVSAAMPSRDALAPVPLQPERIPTALATPPNQGVLDVPPSASPIVHEIDGSKPAAATPVITPQVKADSHPSPANVMADASVPARPQTTLPAPSMIVPAASVNADAPAAAVTVSFQTWGEGHRVLAQWLPTGVVLTPSTEQMRNALTAAAQNGAPNSDNEVLRIDPVNADPQQQDERKRRRQESDAS